MEILTTHLPSGGCNYKFSSINISPMNFLQVNKYHQNCPKDNLEKYLYNIRMLAEEEPRIYDCYVMDLDFIIFYKQLITVSSNLTYNVKVTCPYCNKEINKKLVLEKDVHFKAIDPKIMNGAQIALGDEMFDIIVPTVRDFMKVLDKYVRYKTVTDLDVIKLISLFKNVDVQGNQIEKAVLGATHSDITLLQALKDLYFNRLEDVEIECANCSKTGERRVLTMSVNSLIVDFFRDIYINCPINGDKILFK